MGCSIRLTRKLYASKDNIAFLILYSLLCSSLTIYLIFIVLHGSMAVGPDTQLHTDTDIYRYRYNTYRYR